MRCLVVADLHYSLPQFDWLLAAAPEFDVVIFAGDALDIGSFVDFRAQILVVKKYLSLLPRLRNAGSGCTTRRRRIRRRAGAASGSSATSNWCSGSRSTSRQW